VSLHLALMGITSDAVDQLICNRSHVTKLEWTRKDMEEILSSERVGYSAVHHCQRVVLVDSQQAPWGLFLPIKCIGMPVNAWASTMSMAHGPGYGGRQEVSAYCSPCYSIICSLGVGHCFNARIISWQ
jgi:hypothetical protein